MKGVVDMMHGGRKIKLVGLQPNAFHHFKGTNMLPIKFC